LTVASIRKLSAWVIGNSAMEFPSPDVVVGMISRVVFEVTFQVHIGEVTAGLVTTPRTRSLAVGPASMAVNVKGATGSIRVVQPGPPPAPLPLLPPALPPDPKRPPEPKDPPDELCPPDELVPPEPCDVPPLPGETSTAPPSVDPSTPPEPLEPPEPEA
jgi:hypothetical protein